MDEFLQLIDLLRSGDPVSAQSLTEELQIGEKTLSKKIADSNSLLASHGAGIVSLRSQGYQLTVSDQQAFAAFLKDYIEKQYHTVPDTDRQRFNYILNRLIKSPDYVKRAELADSLFVSEKTVTAVLSAIEQTLSTYGLSLERKPGYGLRVAGPEFSRRQCIINHFIVPYDKFGKNEFENTFSGLILAIARENHLQIPEISFQLLLHYLGVTSNRIKRGFYIESAPAKPLPQQLLSIADQFLAAMQTAGLLPGYTEQETAYLALFLKADRITSNDLLVNMVIPDHLEELTNRLFDYINAQFGLNLYDNLEMRLILLVHLASLDIRMRYNIPVEAAIQKGYKKKYSHAYLVVKHASHILEAYYQKPLSEKELYLLCLFVEFAFEAQRSSARKLNILLACPTGKVSSLMLKMRLEEEFRGSIGTVSMCNVFELGQADLSGIDYVFSTVPIDAPVSVPILLITDIEGQLNLKKVRDTLKAGDLLKSVTNFYEEDLFLPHLEAHSKEECIRAMLEKAGRLHPIRTDALELFIRREALGTTDLVDDVAMVHPMEPISEENIVCAAILKEPIFWGRRDVRFVLMVSTPDSKDPMTKKFYETTANFVLDPEKVKGLIDDPEYSVLINGLLSCSREENKE